jgi:hypothetical protein
MKKLNDRYAPTYLPTRMSLTTELRGKAYQSNKDMGDRFDGYVSFHDRLAAMNAKFPDDLAVVIFPHSMHMRSSLP